MTVLPDRHRSLEEILGAFGIVMVPTSRRCRENETHAAGILTTLYRRHGAAHVELVLKCVTADPANRNALWSETIASCSDVLLHRSAWPAESMVAAFALIDLRKLRDTAVRWRPFPVRPSLRVLIDMDLEKATDAIDGTPVVLAA